MSESKGNDPTSGWNSNRGLTAPGRYRASTPCRQAYKDGLYKGKRVLDWGCGYGQDVKWLKRRGIQAAGYDPAHRPEKPTGKFTAGQAVYIVNVIEKPAERIAMLREVARRLEPGSPLLVAARTKRSINEIPNKRPSGDGFRTPAGTFQKPFEPDQLARLCRKAGLVFGDDDVKRVTDGFGAMIYARTQGGKR